MDMNIKGNTYIDWLFIVQRYVLLSMVHQSLISWARIGNTSTIWHKLSIKQPKI